MQTIDGIINEPTVNFVGKDGFFWWVGEVEDNEDPMELGRVRVRVLGYYTNVRGGTTSDLPTENLPWATVLQHTSQAGNDGQGESSGQLQPGAIVMGFFMDGESAQMPIVIGVLRVKKSADTQDKKVFAFTGEEMEPGIGVNVATMHPGNPNSSMARTKEEGYHRPKEDNTVSFPAQRGGLGGTAGKGSSGSANTAGAGSPANVGNLLNGSSGNPNKPRQPEKPIPAANGVGGPWKTLEYKLSYLLEDLADHAGSLVRAEDGDFLDIVTGKLVSAKALTAKIQNFLSAVFTQVVSAVRQSFSNLAEQLELVNLLGGATGLPFIVFTAVQTAVTTILKSLCNFDSQIIGYIQDPIGSILGVLEGFLDGLIDKAAFVVQGVQAAIDGVICQVQNLLDSVLQVVDTVKTIVDGVGQAQEIIEAWQAGNEIFEAGTDLIKKGISSITGLIALFIKFIGSNCDRQADGGVDTVGWYPLFGVTHCTPEELEEINKIRGSSRGSCGGDNAGGGLLDNIFNEADPYLTAAKTWLDGSYEMFVGTPGRQASVKKSASGTTTTSVKVNQSEYANYTARKKIREENPDLPADEIEQKVQQYVKSQNSGKGDNGSVIADHTSYAGNHTQEVHGDDCKAIDGDNVTNVEGDYFLKVTGDCHIEVGGGFFLSAEGAPKVVDSKGEKKNTKVQKHTIRFGSDVDVNTVGAKFEVQGAECNLASLSTKIESKGTFDCKAGSVAISGGETIISGDNSVEIVTPHLVEMINTPPSPIPKALTGIRRMVGGSVETVMTPGASSDAIPRYTIANPLGPYSLTCGATGYNCNVTTGLYNVNVAAGAMVMNASLAATITCGTGMVLEAKAAVMILGRSIFLN